MTMGSTVQTTWEALRTRPRIPVLIRGMPKVSLFPTHPQFPDDSFTQGRRPDEYATKLLSNGIQRRG